MELHRSIIRATFDISHNPNDILEIVLEMHKLSLGKLIYTERSIKENTYNLCRIIKSQWTAPICSNTRLISKQIKQIWKKLKPKKQRNLQKKEWRRTSGISKKAKYLQTKHKTASYEKLSDSRKGKVWDSLWVPRKSIPNQ